MRLLRSIFAAALMALAEFVTTTAAEARHVHHHRAPARHHTVWIPAPIEAAQHLGRSAHAGLVVAGGVVGEAMRWVGHGNLTGTGPRNWCGDFAQWLLRRSRHHSIGSRLARDAVRAGRPISGPQPGAIMSLPHHAGFVVQVLGQSRVDSIPQPFIAGSLIASLNGDIVQIQRPESDYLFAALPWTSVADRNGATFDSADAVMAYLAVELFKQKPVGDSFGLATPLAQNVVAGQPLAISRATGQLVLARADTYPLSFVARLAPADESAGFTLQPGRGTVTILDWTPITGSAQLSPGQNYFLAATGGLSTVPISPGALCVARVGIAASPSTLIVDPADPILL